jgi:uncharacterized small protein (DUF1192 family)
MNEEMAAYDSYGDALRIDELEEKVKLKEDEVKALGAELDVKGNQLETANAKIEELQKLVDSLKVRNESKYDNAK